MTLINDNNDNNSGEMIRLDIYRVDNKTYTTGKKLYTAGFILETLRIPTKG